MNEQTQKQLGATLWGIADQLRGSMNADDFRDYMLSFLFLRYLSDNYESACKKELGKDYPTESEVETAREAAIALAEKKKTAKTKAGAEEAEAQNPPIVTPLQLWYEHNASDVKTFEEQMRRKVHYVIEPQFLWNSIVEMARTQNGEMLHTLEQGFKYIENKSFASAFQGLFSEINLNSDKLGKKYSERNTKLAQSLPKLLTGWQASPPIPIHWAMPMNI